MVQNSYYIILILTLLTTSILYHSTHIKPVKQPTPTTLTQKNLQITSLTLNHLSNLFIQYKSQFSRTYRKTQQTYRFYIFQQNCKIIYQHNNLQEEEYTYQLGIGQFADLNRYEFLAVLGSFQTVNRGNAANASQNCVGTVANVTDPPQELDWTNTAVTTVLNQFYCGASYAISAIGAIEGLYQIKTQNLQSFSVQQIIDCSGNYGNQGCSGGFMDQSFWYMIDNGIALNKSYPNMISQWQNSSLPNHRCSYTKSLSATSITHCSYIPSQSYSSLISSVITQPTTVAIDITQMQHYQGGIFNGQCNDYSINQAVLLVGYGEENNQTYWKIKNSFGQNWGEDGFALIERVGEDGPGKCGIQLIPTVPKGIN